MKMIYEKPMIKCEEFLANEFVAACGDQNLVYKFECNAGPKSGGDVYLETNGRPGLQTSWFGGGDRELGGYHPCGEKHEASTKDDFKQGYLVYGGGLWTEPTVEDVIVWRGEDGKNIHCTDQLDMNSWETAKS